MKFISMRHWNNANSLYLHDTFPVFAKSRNEKQNFSVEMQQESFGFHTWFLFIRMENVKHVFTFKNFYCKCCKRSIYFGCYGSWTSGNLQFNSHIDHQLFSRNEGRNPEYEVVCELQKLVKQRLIWFYITTARQAGRMCWLSKNAMQAK